MPEPPSGTVTFLFADLEGSTRLLNELGDEYLAGLDAYRSIVRDAIARHDGRELGTEGDSFFIAFASGSESLRCAVDVQLALREHEWPHGLQFSARMGIHTGEATPYEDGYVGLAVHRAARVAAATPTSRWRLPGSFAPTKPGTSSPQARMAPTARPTMPARS